MIDYVRQSLFMIENLRPSYSWPIHFWLGDTSDHEYFWAQGRKLRKNLKIEFFPLELKLWESKKLSRT